MTRRASAALARPLPAAAIAACADVRSAVRWRTSTSTLASKSFSRASGGALVGGGLRRLRRARARRRRATSRTFTPTSHDGFQPSWRGKILRIRPREVVAGNRRQHRQTAGRCGGDTSSAARRCGIAAPCARRDSPRASSDAWSAREASAGPAATCRDAPVGDQLERSRLGSQPDQPSEVGAASSRRCSRASMQQHLLARLLRLDDSTSLGGTRPTFS